MTLGFASVFHETDAWKVRGRGETLFSAVLEAPPTLAVASSRCEARKRMDCIRPVAGPGAIWMVLAGRYDVIPRERERRLLAVSPAPQRTLSFVL